MSTRPVWAEISRSNLLHNFRLLRSLAGRARLLAVVKANAYGHGAALCAKILAGDGATWLGATCADEAIALRAACPGVDILSLGGLWSDEADKVLAHKITPVVWEKFHLDEAARLGKPLSVHLEIDTGMSRQGVQLAELPALLDKLRSLGSVHLDGVLTHFHSPEILDCARNPEQFAQFATAIDRVTAHGFRPRWIHAGNSTSLLSPGADELVRLAEKYGSDAMLRPGLALYGYVSRFTGGEKPATWDNLKAVLSWKSRVTSLRTIAPGETAGYCATFRATRPTRLALLPVGYADGLNRLLSNRASVLVRGERAPIAGRISMDLTTVDVTDIRGVEIGDDAVLIGAQGMEKITAYDHADLAGTIPYEILTNINPRVPRVVVD